MEAASVKDRVIGAVEDTADDLGYMVYDISVLIRGENSKLIVKIDHLRGISHQDCELFSVDLSRRLDGMELLPNYSLEVSSPGLDRKIRTIEEYRRFSGAPAKIVYEEGDMRKAVRGFIVDIGDDAVTVKSEEGAVTIEFSRIVGANLAY